MAEYTIVQVKRDSTLNWYASNPRLALGEPGVDMDLHRFKIGNGIDRWNELPYMDDDLYKLLDEQQQATADYVQDLLNKIAANKLDADQKYNALTSEVRNTSRNLTERMTAVETGQTEYQENLTERQQAFEEAVTGDFEDTKAEVQAGLNEFNETRDSLTVRMNVIAGQATEDTEILDARVDAESYIHPNLGENIRNIHSEILRAKQSGTEEAEARIAADEAEKAERIAAEDAERAARIVAYETEKAERIAADEAERTARIQANETERNERTAADEAERTERISADERHDTEIARLSDRAEKLSEHGEFLQEQINDNTEAQLAVQVQAFREIERHRETERRVEQEIAVREQADEEFSTKDEELSAEIQQEHQERIAEDEELSDRISVLSETVADEAEKLRQETADRQQADDELREWVKHSDDRTSELGEYLQEQINETAEETLRNSIGLYEEAKARQTADNRLKAETDSLQEQIHAANDRIDVNEDDITLEREERKQADIDLSKDITHADNQHSSREDFLQEQADASAAGLFTMQVLLSGEIKRSRKETARLDEETKARKQKDIEISDALEREAEARVQADTEIKATQQEHYQEFLSEQQERRATDARLESELSAVDDKHSEREEQLAGSIQENTASTREKISAHAEFLQEQTNELTGLVTSEMLQNREKFHAVQEDIQLEAQIRSKVDAQIRESIAEVDEAHSLQEAKLQGDIEDSTSAAREKILAAAEHLQEQADILAGEVQQANISNWKKLRELDAEDKSLHEEIRDAEQRLHVEHTETAAEIRQEMQDDVSGLGRNLRSRDEHLQEQADELAGVVAAETAGRWKDKQELRQAIAGTAEKLEGLVSSETLLREEKDAELAGEIATKAKHDGLKDDYLQEQTDQDAQASIQTARNLLQETEYRRRDIQSVREEISSEKLERARDTDSVREKHSADISRLEDADSVGAKIRHDEDTGLQEQINELAELRIKDALKGYKDRLQAKADKQHEEAMLQAEKEYYAGQINDLSDGVVGVILYVCQACKKLRSHIKLIENALVDWGVLDDDDIPPMTETEIDDMIENIFSGNTSGVTEPENEDEAEFLEDINNIFNP